MSISKSKLTQIKKFFSQYPSTKYPKGHILFKPGDKLKNVYFLKSGYVRAYTISPRGEHTFNLFKPMFILSVIHFVTNHRNDYYFQTITPVEMYTAPYSEFKKFIESDKTITFTIMDYFLSSLLNYFVNQGNIVNGTAENKIASVLLQLTHDYGDIKKNKLVVNFPATHRVLANLVGLTRETTSVQMSKFNKIGVISTKRTQFVVHDLEKLKKLAQTL